ncbi:MAG: phosphoribosylglycinamide formyltransferase, partial [Oscillospiraceae bacterium]|nr:phosphoribosylglycinamide formyltransferase [Oscillospiraceae bacterium]
MVKTAVLVSGGGTNLQALIDAKRSGALPDTEFAGVIGSSPDAYALTRAAAAGIPVFTADIADYPNDREGFTDKITDTLNSLGAELVITAGFLYVTAPRFINEYEGRVINIHPALLPSFGGAGCYGIHVHEKALAYGVKVTGATAHFVTQETDT